MRIGKRGRWGRRLLAFVFAVVPGLVMAASADPVEETLHGLAISGVGSVHLTSTVVALNPEPLSALIAEGVALASNLTLKAMPPVLVPPDDLIRYPNSSDQCTYNFVSDLPQADHYYSNLFGIETSPVPSDWGDLGTPSVYHYGSEVSMGVYSRYLRPNGRPALRPSFPAGEHTINWRAHTIIDYGFDVALPAAMLFMSFSKFKAAKAAPAAAANNAGEVAKEFGKFKKAAKWMIDKLKLGVKKGAAFAAEQSLIYVADNGVELCSGLASNDCVLVCPDSSSDCFMFGGTDFEDRSATKDHSQAFTVYDVHDPVMTYNGSDLSDGVTLPARTYEATDFGGVASARIIDQIRAPFDAYDPCGRDAGVGHDIPEFLRIGSNLITWRAADHGPVPGGGYNEVLAYQTIEIEDTQAPIMVTPPGKVIEVDPAVTAISSTDIELGMPRVVDLADPSPLVESDVPAILPINSRTPVTWTTTDASGNAATDVQLLTVKPLGSNTAPTVTDIQAQTLTSQPVDIVLMGSDTDLIDGVFDPLSIRLESRPVNGDFEAPLLPFFIEDFRTSPAGPYGEGFQQAADRGRWLRDNVCTNPDYNRNPDGTQIPAALVIPHDFVYAPRFIQVEDSGEYILIDHYWACDPNVAANATINVRMSRWGADNAFLGEANYPGTSGTFVQDRDEYIYTLNRTGGGSSARLTVQQMDRTFQLEQPPEGYLRDRWRFDINSATNTDAGLADPVTADSLSYARVDSSQGLIYVTDRRRVFVFDVREDFADGISQANITMGERYLGALKGSEQFLCTGSVQWGDSWTGFAMEVDAEGNLYVTGSCDNKIHKFTPSYFDEAGDFVMGDYVGWLGGCSASSNNACDLEKERSRGYACTDSTCTALSGSEPGQFDRPAFIDLDPNDVLYVADSNRVQRFARDGTFGGQARSTGTGINQGDHPEFILGNMGTVRNVTVNSTNFFVVDAEESFVHVFETTPLKDITDSSATVSYVSNFNFHGAEDSFTFSASDGLADSNTGTVRVQVDRNYRPPEAFAQQLEVEEDGSIELTLTGDDPDGVVGTDDVFPLDSLTFAVVEQPAHGSLSGTGVNLIYTPDENFFGEDAFAFVANDGLFDSVPATVSVNVLPIDDRAVMQPMVLPERIGRGFPVLVTADFIDPDGKTLPDAEANMIWVDSFVNVDSRGDFVDPDGPDGPEPPRLEGVYVNEPPPGGGAGSLIADAVFSQQGPSSIELCVFTSEPASATAVNCNSREVLIEDLVSLDVLLTDDPNETAGNFLDVGIVVENTQPEGWAGLNAADVLLSQVVVPEVEVTQLISNSGACLLDGGAISCSRASMAPGETFSTTIRVSRTDTAPLIYDLGVPLAMDTTTSSPALEDVVTATRWLTFLADPTDTDGDGMTDVFEQTYGLNPNSATDANIDTDGDRLTNLEEYEARTNPLLSDTDGDGIDDNEDFCPVDPGGTVEGTDGLCEQDIRTSPVLRIIQMLEGRRQE